MERKNSCAELLAPVQLKHTSASRRISDDLKPESIGRPKDGVLENAPPGSMTPRLNWPMV